MTLCIPDADLAEAVRDLLDESADQGRLIVLESLGEDLSSLNPVQLWIPGPEVADAARVARVLGAMPNLQAVQAPSAGVERLLGLMPAGVQLCDARGVHGSATSEWALMAILAVLRDMPGFERARQEQSWQTHLTDELAQKRVLIIGAGDVGQSLARRVSACDAQPIMVARSAREGVHAVTELPRLLPEADIVVLLIPQTSETIGMVDAAFLSRMQDGALLVNAARGRIVRTDALLAELRSGRLRAALDVTDPEPLPPEHPLWSAPNLLLTPHVGGAVPGLNRRLARLIADQTRRLDSGEALINVVTGEY